MNEHEIAVRADGLTKVYSEVTAVDNLDLAVRTGEIYGFLGRNGAGKTTTIRMLLGLVRPTGGRVLIFGRDVSVDRREAVATVGSLVETATAYPTLTVRENLEVQRRLTHSGHAALDEVVELLGLEEYIDRRAGRLSLGNKQRLALARALLAAPQLLVLDEPANALDPAGIVEIRELLRRLAREQRITVFVSSHILGEIEQLADRIGIIHRGTLREEIDAHEVRESAQVRLELEVSDRESALAVLREVPEAEEIVSTNGRLEIRGAGLDPAGVARRVVEAGVGLRAMVPVTEDLESRFLRITGDET